MGRSSEVEWKFGRALKLYAEAKLGKGYQSKLAIRMGMKSMAVNQHFSSNHPMSEATIQKIATALDEPYDELLVSALDLLADQPENDDENDDDEEEVAPRSATAQAPAPAKAGKPHRRSKETGRVRAAKPVKAQPAQATKDEVEAAPAAKASPARKGVRRRLGAG